MVVRQAIGDSVEVKEVEIFGEVSARVGAVKEALLDVVCVEERDFDVMEAQQFSKLQHTVDWPLER